MGKMQILQRNNAARTKESMVHHGCWKRVHGYHFNLTVYRLETQTPRKIIRLIVQPKTKIAKEYFNDPHGREYFVYEFGVGGFVRHHNNLIDRMAALAD